MEGPNDRRGVRRGLLVIDASYSYETLSHRKQLDSVTCRDLDGYFSEVWTVHPLATLVTSPQWTSKYGRPVVHQINSTHVFIEGKIGRFEKIARVFPLNFLISQVLLFRRLSQFLKSHRLSVVRAGDPLYCGLLGLILSRTGSVPFVVRVNGNNVKVRQTSGKPIMPRLFHVAAIERGIEKFVLSRADWVFAPNADNREFAIAAGANRERSSVISFGGLLDRQHFLDPCQRPSADADLAGIGIGDEPFLLVIGRLIQPKFPDHVVRVTHFLKHRGFLVKTVFVGSGEMETKLRQLAASLGIADQIMFAGDRDQGWLWRMLPRAAFVLSPSTGRALSEAALAGCAIVAYDSDWQRDMIDDGKTGFLVPFQDWRAMGKAALKLMTDRKLAHSLGQKARERALVLLDPSVATNDERLVYSRLLDERRLPLRGFQRH